MKLEVMDMQEQDFLWFVNNYQSLFAKYGHKFLAIKNKSVLGTFDSTIDGVLKISESEPLGTFIVQECSGDISAYTAYISTPGVIK